MGRVPQILLYPNQSIFDSFYQPIYIFLYSALQTFRVETDDHGGGGGGSDMQQELELHGCEVAALMNLVGTDTMVEEATALIPSLSRFPEAAIDEILDLIRNTMIRVVN
jgi:DNA-directed RNA polymerase II subunit RPB4